MSRRALILITALFIVSAVLPGTIGAAPIDTGEGATRTAITLREVSHKIDPDVLAALQNGGTTRALVVLREQADVSGAATLRTKRDKGAFVLNRLRDMANRTQPTVRAALDRLGLSYRSYYVVNMFAVEGLDAATAAQLAALPQVGRVEGDPDMRLPAPIPSAAVPEAANGVEWGIQKIKADKMWAMGFRGQGTVVANQDTGVQWDHPALQGKFRGWNAFIGRAHVSHNWWDAIHSDIGGGRNPCGYSVKQPCDDSGHGTHTMGTIVGSDGANQIGVAPKAKWIACRNMDQGVGRPSTYAECFEFFIAPWNHNGKHPRPGKAPDVVSNSWGCPIGAPPGGEDCQADSLQTATENVRAAGIFVAVSAGNAGPSCSTVEDPSAIYDAAFTVGATNNSDALASFSSRGPVTVDGSNRLKPDLSAPGVNVRSSYPTNSYATLSGTSMASPHVAGAVALLWNAKPALVGDVDATEAALTAGANPHVLTNNQTCGGTTGADIPNNLFGYGRLDVLKAFRH